MALPIFMASETIKPSSPTPSHLTCYNLSFLDQLSFSNYIPLVLFYPNNTNYNASCENSQDYNTVVNEISRQLKHSLSQTLTQYYPFAGRLSSSPTHVHCNDEGVEFQETRIECNLVEILEKPGNVDLELLFPDGMVWGPVENDKPLVVVRLSRFECGGISVAVCMSHQVADAATLFTFLTYWAALTRQSGQQVSPHFISPPVNNVPKSTNISTALKFQRPKKCWVTMRVLFHNTKISELKAVIGGQNRSRVEVVSALILKSAIKAAKVSSGGSFKPSAFFHVGNMRPKMVPPMPETCVGNICFLFPIPPILTESESNLKALADQIKKSKMQGEKGVRDFEGLRGDIDNIRELAMRNNYNLYACSSMCNFPLYDVDFGWGKPIRATLADTMSYNAFLLTDTPARDGIEALVSLLEKDMQIFQHVEELLAFGSFV